MPIEVVWFFIAVKKWKCMYNESKNGSVNVFFSRDDVIIFEEQEWKFIEYNDYGFTCTLKHIKSHKEVQVFPYKDELIIKLNWIQNLFSKIVFQVFFAVSSTLSLTICNIIFQYDKSGMSVTILSIIICYATSRYGTMLSRKVNGW